MLLTFLDLHVLLNLVVEAVSRVWFQVLIEVRISTEERLVNHSLRSWYRTIDTQELCEDRRKLRGQRNENKY